MSSLLTFLKKKKKNPEKPKKELALKYVWVLCNISSYNRFLNTHLSTSAFRDTLTVFSFWESETVPVKLSKCRSLPS